MKINIYIPVIGPKEGIKGTWGTINGASDPDEDVARRKASRHASVRSGDYEIKRVDIEEVDADAWYAPNPY